MFNGVLNESDLAFPLLFIVLLAKSSDLFGDAFLHEVIYRSEPNMSVITENSYQFLKVKDLLWM